VSPTQFDGQDPEDLLRRFSAISGQRDQRDPRSPRRAPVSSGPSVPA
jgi:hypothetical protein